MKRLPFGRFSFCLLSFGLVLVWPQQATQSQQQPTPNNSSGSAKNKNHVEVSLGTIAMSGENAVDWVNLGPAKLRFISKGGPVLVGVVPGGQPLGPIPGASSINLVMPTPGGVDTWLISIVRDYSYEVAAFEVGHMSRLDSQGLFLPTSLLTLDVAPAGPHSYTLRVKYVGSPKMAPHFAAGQLQILQSTFTAAEL